MLFVVFIFLLVLGMKNHKIGESVQQQEKNMNNAPKQRHDKHTFYQGWQGSHT